MLAARRLSDQERAIIVVLIEARPENRHLIGELDDLLVKPMNDGGMGSLSLIPKGTGATARAMGKEIICGNATDSDGVPLSLALNVDKEGYLYELDIWKVDFSPTLRLPSPSAISIVASRHARVDEY